MNATALSPLQGTTAGTLIVAAFCEACERLIAVRALLDDPHHLTRRQGMAMTHLLHDGLRSVQRQLDTIRPALRDSAISDGAASRALAGIGMAVAGLRQVHAHLGYLGSRWPLGTADLFVRKLVAEGMRVPVPTLCVTDQPYDDIEELGARLAARLRAIGMAPRLEGQRTPLLALPAMDLLEPLSWPALLYGLAAAIAEQTALLPAVRDPGQEGDRYRRACIAAVAARLVGEPTFVACAVRALLARLSGAHAGDELPALYHYTYTLPYAAPTETDDLPVCRYYQDLLVLQRRLGGWGRNTGSVDDQTPVEEWPEVEQLAERVVPAPVAIDRQTLETLHGQLCDGRPINARPAALPPEFERRLDEAVDSERFYALVQQVNERPCAMATILAVGWRYKLRRTYPVCRELMIGDRSWEAAFEALAAHVLERSSLLQQSMEAAYVQQVLAAHGGDR